MARPGSPAASQATARAAAGGQGLLDAPGHAFGPAPPPSINTMMAARRALSLRPAPNRHFCVAGNVRPHVNQVSAESASIWVLLARRRMLCSSRWVIPGLAEG